MLVRSSQIYLLCWLGAVVLTFTACGLASPDYQPYEIADDGAADGTTGSIDSTDEADGGEACPAADTAWQTNLKAKVDERCSAAGCHANGADLDLDKDEDAYNRQQLYAFIAGDIANLTDVIHGGVHPGGDFTGELPLNAIAAWHTAESECP